MLYDLPKYATSIAAVVLSCSLSAQVWTTDLAPVTDGINWVEQADDGTIIIGGSGGMAGLNHETGEVAWQDERLRRQNRSTVRFLAGLPLFTVEGSSSKRATDYGELAIVNSYDGTVLFSSRDAGVKVLEYTLVEETQGMLFQLQTGELLELAYFDLASGKALWKQPLRNAVTSGRGIVQTALELPPVVTPDGALLLALDEGLKALELGTGAVRWEQGYDNEVSHISVSENGRLAFVGIGIELDVLEVKTGKQRLAEAIGLRANLVGLTEADGEYILRTTRGINCFDPATNTLKWNKPSTTARSDDAFLIPGGYLTATTSEYGVSLTKLDPSGKKVWAERASGRILYYGQVDQGILYLTDNGGNIVRYDDGKDHLKKNVKIKGTPAAALDDANNRLLIFSRETLSEIDLSTATVTEIAEDIDLDRFDASEQFANLELVPEGYFISTSQHAALINAAGELVYNHYYKPVRLGSAAGLAMAAGSYMGVDVMGMKQSAQWMQRLSGTEKTTSTQEVATQDFGLIVSNNPIFIATTARYYATQASKEHLYVFTEGDEGPSLYRVVKATGETENTYLFNVKEPTYVVDEYANQLYYVDKDRLVADSLSPR